ncbi:hypothetical protein BC832DRAFT_556631 [Gaertneriomyces semiglobifer]|nr:hypothetical protein BC832DRAFT_569406 [Gaertneriomyces semiglobifer]KAI9005218.1 hypothetical protein BC832DRAFT_556631 [Gaertneriomyces semiglobifer]
MPRARKADWLERQAKTSRHATYRSLSRVADDTSSVVTYQSSNMMLVEISGPPTTAQDHQHPAEDAIKLELEAERVLVSRLLPYARLPASVCSQLCVFTLQGIGSRLTLHSHSLTARGTITVKELYTFQIAFSRVAVANIRKQFVLCWLLRKILMAETTAEAKVASIDEAVAGEQTVRDWLPETFGLCRRKAFQSISAISNS